MGVEILKIFFKKILVLVECKFIFCMTSKLKINIPEILSLSLHKYKIIRFSKTSQYH